MLFHVKHRPLAYAFWFGLTGGLITLWPIYQSWRRTRYVRRWRKVIEDTRAFRRMFGLPAGSTAVTYRIDAMANQLRGALTTVTDEPR